MPSPPRLAGTSTASGLEDQMQFPFSRSTNPNVDLSSLDAFNEGAP